MLTPKPLIERALEYGPNDLCGMLAADLVAARAVLSEIRDEIHRNFECHREDEQDESGHCDGDDCMRCWMDLTIENVLPAVDKEQLS